MKGFSLEKKKYSKTSMLFLLALIIVIENSGKRTYNIMLHKNIMLKIHDGVVHIKILVFSWLQNNFFYIILDCLDLRILKINLKKIK
jgi:hypothetical protein